MKKVVLHLFIVISIALFPVEQAMAGDTMDQMDSHSRMDGCSHCDQKPDIDQGGCKNVDCVTGGCLNNTTASVFFYVETTPSVTPTDLTSSIVNRYQSRYLSQVPRPLFRPPIA
jgi:hypothetical protein